MVKQGVAENKLGSMIRPTCIPMAATGVIEANGQSSIIISEAVRARALKFLQLVDVLKNVIELQQLSCITDFIGSYLGVNLW